MIGKTALSEDFTFPAITDQNSLYHRRFSGPVSSLWYVPSTFSDQSKPSNECDFDFDRETHQRRSFSFLEGGTRAIDLPRELEFLYDGRSETEFDVEEEKMDMLWEDFNINDELRRACLDRKEANCSKGVFLDPSICPESNADRAEMAEFCCVKALKMSKSSRPGLFVMLKVLKKLFLLQNSQCPKRTSHHYHSRR
ncbi:uncharacterized protein LOC131237433 [Magnolia sinica]|uniref:uncharacterized protein LOC131237433 n=1 Tax=Magnolia sinica TaxID=86752 RepID=UPI0026587AAC|nr:uncharacterized protein LOC131237433 [Magnolia sinica]